MPNMLLVTAVALAAAGLAGPAPALALDGAEYAFQPHRADSPSFHRDGRDGDRWDRRDRRRDGRRSTTIVWDNGGYYGDRWALYNNRSWNHDSYNDWWHERPNRAFPRWVQNGNCDRSWWAGNVLQCAE